ncbi:MAG TPA: hypothetical protein PKH92_12950 [Anaerolineaceae bacterium]|jgi:ABC-type uncharacterized transport system permease subunit|nr:hypothetical protein [Anaerolineaceae bacterium]HQF64160.1 hypothetical protein [Anaerolineaceae bacterium]HQH87090.1 hypothetical protein [Anaerolineaceae bacterium]HQN42760.1 hypothetical protein [Anaerolineaceae bacterium]
MNNRTRWLLTKLRLGWAFLAAGLTVSLAGIFIGLEYDYLPYNFRVITGLGILLLGIGISYLVRYWAAQKDETAAQRAMVDERDERTQGIRARAGNRAYWVSAVMLYAGIMWAGMAANGSLPALAGDTLWYYLAAAVVIPFGVYIVSLVVAEHRS